MEFNRSILLSLLLWGALFILARAESDDNGNSKWIDLPEKGHIADDGHLVLDVKVSMSDEKYNKIKDILNDESKQNTDRDDTHGKTGSDDITNITLIPSNKPFDGSKSSDIDEYTKSNFPLYVSILGISFLLFVLSAGLWCALWRRVNKVYDKIDLNQDESKPSKDNKSCPTKTLHNYFVRNFPQDAKFLDKKIIIQEAKETDEMPATIEVKIKRSDDQPTSILKKSSSFAMKKSNKPYTNRRMRKHTSFDVAKAAKSLMKKASFAGSIGSVGSLGSLGSVKAPEVHDVTDDPEAELELLGDHEEVYNYDDYNADLALVDEADEGRSGSNSPFEYLENEDTNMLNNNIQFSRDSQRYSEV